MQEKVQSLIQPPDEPCPICHKPIGYSRNKNDPPANAAGYVWATSAFVNKLLWDIDWSNHDICKKKYDQQKAEEQKAKDFQEHQKVVSEKYRRARIPEAWALTKTFDKLKLVPGKDKKEPGNERGIAALETWNAKSDRHGVMLMGPPGTGKTHLIVAFTIKMIAEGYDIRFYKGYDLLASVRAGINELGGMDGKIEKLCEIPYLVIDDIGVEKESEFSVETFTRIIDNRMEKHLPTFMTSNSTPEDMLKAFNERMYSRIKMCCLMIRVTGEDKRTDQQIDLQAKFEERFKAYKERK